MGKVRDKIDQTKREWEDSKRLYEQGKKDGRWEKR